MWRVQEQGAAGGRNGWTSVRGAQPVQMGCQGLTPISSCGSWALSQTCREGPALGSRVPPPPIQRHFIVRLRGLHTHNTHTRCSHARTFTLTFVHTHTDSQTLSHTHLCTHVAPHTRVYTHTCTLIGSYARHTHLQCHTFSQAGA